jgi:hypothetical protein
MKQNWIFACVVSGVMVFALPVWAENSESKTANVKYEKQSTFICNKQEFQIPPYFPFGDKFVYNNKPPASDLYLTARENECTPDHFNAVLGLDPYCNGANICIKSSFSYSKIGTDLRQNLQYAFSRYTKEVELDKGKIGYFVPSVCYAYCNTARLIWFNYDYNKDEIYIISTKNANTQKTIDELVKSANSYINNQK